MIRKIGKLIFVGFLLSKWNKKIGFFFVVVVVYCMRLGVKTIGYSKIWNIIILMMSIKWK